jgi:TM2 domain-containing membrane protein YozV
MEDKVIVPQRSPKSTGIAALLSIFFPFGVGALYNEQKQKALLQFLIPFGLIIALARGGNGVVFGLALAAFYFYQIFDNIQSARAINSAGAAAQSITPERPEAVPSGSVFWGLFLIVLAVILILANFEIISYRTLGNYWPVAVIIVGLKLVLDSMGKSKKQE